MPEMTLGFHDIVFGVRAEGPDRVNRLLKTLLAQHTDSPVVEGGTERRITVRTPHQLVKSPLLAGILQIAAAATPEDRQASRMEATLAVIQKHRHVARRLVLSLCAVLTSAARGSRGAVDGEGLTIRLDRFTLAHQNLILSEVYRCIAPADAPRFWWYRPKFPGKYAIAGFRPAELSLAKDEALREAGRVTRSEPRLHRSDGNAIFLGDQIFNDPVEAATMVVGLIVNLDKGALEAEGLVRLFGHATLAEEAVGEQNRSDAIERMCRELKGNHEAHIMQREGGDTVIALGQLSALSQEAGFKLRHGPKAVWLVPMVLAMAYHSVRKPDEPVAIFSEGAFLEFSIRIGWPHVERLPIQALGELLHRWTALTGQAEAKLLFM